MRVRRSDRPVCRQQTSEPRQQATRSAQVPECVFVAYTTSTSAGRWGRPPRSRATSAAAAPLAWAFGSQAWAGRRPLRGPPSNPVRDTRVQHSESAKQVFTIDQQLHAEFDMFSMLNFRTRETGVSIITIAMVSRLTAVSSTQTFSGRSGGNSSQFRVPIVLICGNAFLIPTVAYSRERQAAAKRVCGSDGKHQSRTAEDSVHRLVAGNRALIEAIWQQTPQRDESTTLAGSSPFRFIVTHRRRTGSAGPAS